MWLQVHLWAWVVASVWCAGVVMGVRRDVDTEERHYGSRDTRHHRHNSWRPATKPVLGVSLDTSQLGYEEPRSIWPPQWRTSTNGRISQDGRAHVRTHSSPRARQDAHAVPETQRGRPTLPTDHRRLTAHTGHRFRADAEQRLRTAADARGALWGDARGNRVEARRADHTRNQVKRTQGGNRSPNADGDLSNRYRFGSEASLTLSRSHRLRPEVSQTAPRYSRVGKVEKRRSQAPHTRRFHWTVSEAPPRMPTESRERYERLRYSEAQSAASRSFPGSAASDAHEDRRQEEVHGPSMWPAHHTSPGQSSGDSSASESSSGTHDDPDTYGTSQAHTPLESDGEATPLATPVSQDLHPSRHDTPHQEAESQREAPDWCCGSIVPLDHENAIFIGGLSRVASAGSVKVVGIPSVDEDVLPPFTVRDLRVTPLDAHTVSLTWTAPGDDLDSGIASSYVIRMSDVIHDLKESRFDLAPNATLLDVADLLNASDVYQTSGTEVSVTVPLAEQLQMGHVYFVALRALDDHNNASPVSNVARFSIPRPLSDAPVVHATTAEDDVYLRQQEEAERNKSLARLPEEENASLPAAQDEGEGTVPPHGETRISLEPTLTSPEPTESNLIVPETSEPSQLVTEPSEPVWTSAPGETLDMTTAIPIDGDLTVSSEPDQSLLPRRGRKRKNRKNKKVRKAKKNRRDGKKNRKRKDKRRKQGREEELEEVRPETEGSTPGYVYGDGECHIDEAHEGTISLCDARYSLAVVIAYFEQNADFRHMDYLWAAMHSLNQRTRPPWQRERRSSRRHLRRGGKSRVSRASANRDLLDVSSG